jgi:hypothetical protein
MIMRENVRVAIQNGLGLPIPAPTNILLRPRKWDAFGRLLTPDFERSLPYPLRRRSPPEGHINSRSPDDDTIERMLSIEVVDAMDWTR